MGMEAARSPLLQAVVGSKVFLGQNVGVLPPGKAWRCFRTGKAVCYHALCDDFGPMNMASVVQFIQMLDTEIASFPNSQILYCAESGRRALTNAVFLLGAYMILKLNMTSQEVAKCFSWLDSTLVEPFRDATFSPSSFDLELMDCWKGFERGKGLGWIKLPSKLSQVWGKINLDEYKQFEDPNNADLHEVVPCKLVAFKGPKDLGDRDYFDDKRGFRHFSPGHYAKVFTAIGVSSVVRLNAADYPAEAFTAQGVSHHDLIFEDCTAPPSTVVEAFFKIVDSAPGLVAVHCKAGLGRTGTLIALYMMRAYGFSAREAMGWLRIMRPGSVIGQQQHYLCEVERGVREVQQRLAREMSPRAARANLQHGAAPPTLHHAAAPPGPAVAATQPGGGTTAVAPQPPCAATAATGAAALAEQVTSGMERRGAARLRASPPGVVLPAIRQAAR